MLEQRRVAGHLPLGLGQLHLERPRIDLGQQVAALDGLALAEMDLHELAVDPGLRTVTVLSAVTDPSPFR